MQHDDVMQDVVHPRSERVPCTATQLALRRSRRLTSPHRAAELSRQPQLSALRAVPFPSITARRRSRARRRVRRGTTHTAQL